MSKKSLFSSFCGFLRELFWGPESNVEPTLVELEVLGDRQEDKSTPEKDPFPTSSTKAKGTAVKVEADVVPDVKPVRTEIHVVPADKGWAVKESGKTKALAKCRTKKEAVAKGRLVAKKKKTELVIHNKDGKISNKNSYGNDPRRSKDTVH